MAGCGTSVTPCGVDFLPRRADGQSIRYSSTRDPGFRTPRKNAVTSTDCPLLEGAVEDCPRRIAVGKFKFKRLSCRFFQGDDFGTRFFRCRDGAFLLNRDHTEKVLEYEEDQLPREEHLQAT